MENRIAPTFLFGEIAWPGWTLALLAIVAARPVALRVSFLGTRLPVKEQPAAMWSGPKGFASVVCGLLVLEAGVESSDERFHLLALAIVLSFLGPLLNRCQRHQGIRQPPLPRCRRRQPTLDASAAGAGQPRQVAGLFNPADDRS